GRVGLTALPNLSKFGADRLLNRNIAGISSPSILSTKLSRRLARPTPSPTSVHLEKHFRLCRSLPRGLPTHSDSLNKRLPSRAAHTMASQFTLRPSGRCWIRLDSTKVL